MGSNVENCQEFAAEPKEAHNSGLWEQQDSHAGVKVSELLLRSTSTSVMRSIKNSIVESTMYLRIKLFFEGYFL